ncbi:polar amino acid transport system substrate-binding protein [Nonomuraea solani]|uniref:Polar amino acid transport system substrate-binding protein n=1 Tax=Nonomuraea solani TaxID=1144553 RepID=A0A1H6DKW5_9ACTN|nr:ABC transporter substrate-binding protein [Nonomuraea solani]SEG85235.1 polar amino acid transport system substrate-binding protein [Nonomuraea solani]
MSKHATAALAVAVLLLAGCGANPEEAEGVLDTPAGQPAAAQTKDQALHDRLPDKVRQTGKLVSVNNGSFPPYEIAGPDGRSLTGAAADMSEALGQLLGVKIEHVTVDGLPSSLTGIASGRYDFAIGPVGDFADRQKNNDFVDWVKEYVVFAVPKGNPDKIGSVADTCGLKISVMAGGSAEAVIKSRSAACVKEGKPKITVQSYKDQPTSVLAVSSGRADAFFSSQAPLTYFVAQAGGKLELAGKGQANGFDDLFQGAVVGKDSPLRDVLKDGFQKLMDNGTYAKIMDKWGTAGNKLDRAGVNLATS